MLRSCQVEQRAERRGRLNLDHRWRCRVHWGTECGRRSALAELTVMSRPKQVANVIPKRIRLADINGKYRLPYVRKSKSEHIVVQTVILIVGHSTTCQALHVETPT